MNLTERAKKWYESLPVKLQQDYQKIHTLGFVPFPDKVTIDLIYKKEYLDKVHTYEFDEVGDWCVKVRGIYTTTPEKRKQLESTEVEFGFGWTPVKNDKLEAEIDRLLNE